MEYDYVFEITKNTDCPEFNVSPAIVEKQNGCYVNVNKSDDIFFLNEDGVNYFLEYFFEKYFDKKLYFNIYRETDCYRTEPIFEWWSTDNYYTYNTIKDMCKEIIHVIVLLKNDPDNEELIKIKEHFPRDFFVFDNRKNGILFVDEIIDFYNRFVDKILTMIDNNKNSELISIMGP